MVQQQTRAKDTIERDQVLTSLTICPKTSHGKTKATKSPAKRHLELSIVKVAES